MVHKLSQLGCLTAIGLALAACSNSTQESQSELHSNSSPLANSQTMPNIVILYMDDLGYGDVSAYNSGALNTPNIDRMAAEGVLFERGYATAATCTPSRYSLLTGDYPLRNQKAKVLKGDAPLLISPNQETLPKMLQKAGYTTGAVGKWHLGLGNGKINWNQHISPGANEIGFDYSFIMGATNDRTPNVYVKNGHVVNLDPNDPIEVSYRTNFPGEVTGAENPELLKMKLSNGHAGSINNGVSRIGFQRGGRSAMWIDEDMSDLFLQEATEFVERNQNKPFFLYYAFHQPHVPRLPHNRFVGASGQGPRGDAILEADWAIGEFINRLDELGLSDNTIIVFSSDNGHVLDDGYVDQAQEMLGEHTPWGPFRGGKYSLLDAGTHVPFIVRWKGKVKPSVSKAMVSQHDLLASFASLTGQKNKSRDSENVLPALLGKSNIGRNNLVVQGTVNSMAYHKDGWVYIPSHKRGGRPAKMVNNESGFAKFEQLYNLADDPHQDYNLAKTHPEKLAKMKQGLKQVISN